MLRQPWICGLLLGCILLQAVLVTSQVDDDDSDNEEAFTINHNANFYVKFLLQHFTAEFGVEGQSEHLKDVASYWESFGKGYIPTRYLEAGSLFRVMNKMLTEKKPFLYQKPIADYDTRIVQIEQGASSRSVTYKSLVGLFFRDSADYIEYIRRLTIDIKEMAKQSGKLDNLAASVYLKKRRRTFYAIMKIFVDKISHLFQEIYSLEIGVRSFLSNAEYLKMYFVEQYRISTQCGLINNQATPVQFHDTYLETREHIFYNFIFHKTKNTFRHVPEERGDLFLRPIDNLKSRTVPASSLPAWFWEFWILAKDGAKPGAHAIPVCDMMQQYFDKGKYTKHPEDYFAKGTFWLLMKYWIESQYYEMEKAQELIDEEVTKLVDPSSPQMSQRMEQCYLQSVLSAWYAQIGNFREQLDQNRTGALTAARRYLVKMDLWPKYAGEQEKALEQLSGKQLGTGQQVMPQAMVKVPNRELWHYIPSKTMSMSQLDAIKNSFDADIFAGKNKDFKKSDEWISKFAKPGSVPKLRSLKKANEWMYYRVRLAVYLAFLKPCSNTPSSLKQTFKKAPFGGLNLFGSKLSRKKKPSAKSFV